MEQTFAIFDLDGTIADSIPCWRRLYREYLASRGVCSPPEEIMLQTFTLTAPEAASLFLRSFHLPGTVEEAVADINRLIEGHYRTDIPLKRGVDVFLSRCRRAGWRMCVASATNPALIDLCLRRLGVRDYFAFLLSCVEVGVGKNRPDVYLEAARRLGGRPDQTIVFEDAAYAAQTAKAAGFRVAGVYDAASPEIQQALRENADWYILRWDEEETFTQLKL